MKTWLSKNRFIRAFTVFGTLLTIGALTGTAAAQPIYPIPDPDPFYAPVKGMGRKAPGTVLGVRPMPPLGQFPNTTVTMVKFRSTNSQNHPIAATTLVLTPANHRPGAPLLSYQHFINSLGARCTISRALYTDDPGTSMRVGLLMTALNAALAQGWSVALPDHLGPTQALGAARLGGQITLDGVRAAQRVPSLGLAGSPAALLGYSGGGIATAWAAAMAPRYAPELRLVGSAAGGAPFNISKMAAVLAFNPHPGFGLAMAAAIGLEREYPDRLPMSEQMNGAGLALRNAMANSCTDEILMQGLGHNAGELARTRVMMHNPRAWKVSDENSLELFPDLPRVPIFEWHSPTDALVPVDAIVNTLHRYRRAGLPVQMNLIGTPDHLTAAALGAPDALAWIADRFAGKPAPSNI